VFVFIRYSRRYAFVFKWSLRDPFLKRIVCAMNQNTKQWFTFTFSRKQEYQFVAYWSKNYILQFLVVQEDDSEWSTTKRTAQVSLQRFQVSYLTNVPSYCFYLFPYCTCYCVFTNCVLLFFFSFFMISFQVPLISCASSWRAGETKNGVSPKFCRFYSQSLVHALYYSRVLQGYW
jgi:hypothetical protein